jgi:predicted alpha/beta-fold hydrolase
MKCLFFLSIVTLFASSCESPDKDCTTSFDSEFSEEVFSPEKIEIPSLDKLPISANVYEVDPEAPVIVLCHQARFNKFEYEGIAQKLMKLGFNSIAIDQRSGGPIANQANETTLAAMEKDLPTDYLDAEQDIIAAVNYAADRYNGPIILWGSSYSSTLTLYVAESNKNVKAAIAFSPGNYFKEEKGSLIEVLSEFEKPLFVTSSNYEATDLSILMNSIEMNDEQMQFIPEGDGHHGSRALWPSQSGSEEYWVAIEVFLEALK